jgi:hypothetical protein
MVLNTKQIALINECTEDYPASRIAIKRDWEDTLSVFNLTISRVDMMKNLGLIKDVSLLALNDFKNIV